MDSRAQRPIVQWGIHEKTISVVVIGLHQMELIAQTDKKYCRHK